MSNDLTTALDALEAAAGRAGWRINETLQPGLSMDEIEAIEARIGLRLPDDVRALYQRWNGTVAGDPYSGYEFVPEGALLPLEAAAAYLTSDRKLTNWKSTWFPIIFTDDGPLLVVRAAKSRKKPVAPSPILNANGDDGIAEVYKDVRYMLDVTARALDAGALYPHAKGVGILPHRRTYARVVRQYAQHQSGVDEATRAAPLLEVLDQKNWLSRIANGKPPKRVMAGVPDSAIRKLFGALSDILLMAKPARNRETAIDVIDRLLDEDFFDESILPALNHVLDDPSILIAKKAAVTLCATDHPSAFGTVSAWLTRYGHDEWLEWMRTTAPQLAKTLNEDQFRKELSFQIFKSVPLNFIGPDKPPEARAALVELAAADMPELRAGVARAIAVVMCEGAEEGSAMAKLVEDQSVMVRLAAVNELKGVKTAEADRLLTIASNDVDDQVRREVRRILDDPYRPKH
jgi:hypothetical protein